MSFIAILATAIFSILFAFTGVALCLRPIRTDKDPSSAGFRSYLDSKWTIHRSYRTQRLIPGGMAYYFFHTGNKTLARAGEPKRAALRTGTPTHPKPNRHGS